MSLRLARGEMVGLIGPNGAGKTSFVRALLGRQDYTKLDLSGAVLLAELRAVWAPSAKFAVEHSPN